MPKLTVVPGAAAILPLLLGVASAGAQTVPAATSPATPAVPAIPVRADAPAAFGTPSLTVAASVEADFNGDGLTDTAFTLQGEDARYLVVALGEGKGLRRVGLLRLDAYPLGPASLAVTPKGVLTMTDLTGGTSAYQTIYRYRYEAASDRMRLIGQDVEFYSRTWQHGSTHLSRNYLTGESEKQVGTLSADHDLRFGKVQRRQDKPTLLYLEDSPDPARLLGNAPD